MSATERDSGQHDDQLFPDAPEAQPAPSGDRADGGRLSGLVRSSGVVAIGTMASRITGLLRTILTAGALGALGIGAAYNLANNTPNMVYDLLLGGILSATLVPTLVAAREEGDEDGTAAVLTVATVALLAITVVGVVLAPAIIGGYAWLAERSGERFSADQQSLAVVWLRLFVPQVLFYGLTTLGSAYLNAHRRFAAAALAPVVNNLWMILLLVGLWRTLDGVQPDQLLNDVPLLLAVGLGTTAGIAAMALVLWPALRRARLPLRWRFDPRHPAVRQVGRLSGWTLGYVVANQVTMFVVAGLAGAAFSYWTYAYQFFQLPYGVFTVSIMTAFTPELAAMAGRGERDAFRQRFLQGLRLVLLTLLPATVLLALLARPLLWVLLIGVRQGQFNLDDLGSTAGTLAALAWGTVGFSVYLFVLRAFYALSDTRTPFVVNVFENVLTLAIAGLLVSSAVGLEWGVQGLAWSWSLAYLASAVVAFAVLRRRVGAFGFDTAVATTAAVIRLMMATAVMAVVVLVAVHLLPETGAGAWTTLAVGTFGGLLVYAGVLFVLGVQEIRELPRVLLRR